MANAIASKLSDLGLSEKQTNVGISAFMSTKEDGTIDWTRFMSLTGYSRASARVTLNKVKREIKALLEAKGVEFDPDIGETNDKTGGTNDVDAILRAPKRKAGGRPAKDEKPAKKRTKGEKKTKDANKVQEDQAESESLDKKKVKEDDAI